MPEGDRRIVIGFGIVVAILTIIALWQIPAYNKGQREQREKAASYEAYDDQDIAGCSAEPTDFDRLACLANKVTANQEQERGRADLNAQQDMATWAVAMLWVSGIGIVVSVAGIALIYATLQETREMTIATREIGENQTRAYISFGAIKWKRKSNEILSMPIKNTGVTPARGVRYNFAVFLGTEASADGVLGLGPIPETLGASYDLGQGEAGNIAYFDEGDAVERALNARIEAEKPCRLIVVVRYSDVFGRFYETKHDTKIIQSPKGSGEISRWDPITTEREISEEEYQGQFPSILI